MTPTRRLATFALAAALVPVLGACGDGGFGDFLKGSGSAGTATSTPTTSESTGLPVGTESPGTLSPSDSTTGWAMTTGPSESPTDLSSTDATSTDTASPTNSDTASPSSGPATAGTTSGSASASPQGGVVQVDGRTIQGVPVGLAFPEGAKIEGTNAFEGGGGSVVLSAPAEEKVFGYYRSALSGAGYRVVSDTAGLLAFTGHGYRGTIVGTGTGAVVTWSPAKG